MPLSRSAHSGTDSQIATETLANRLDCSYVPVSTAALFKVLSGNEPALKEQVTKLKAGLQAVIRVEGHMRACGCADPFFSDGSFELPHGPCS